MAFNPPLVLNSPLVLYHGGSCRDGFCAAWLMGRHVFAHPDFQAEYRPVNYGQEPPYELARDRAVHIVDFSYSREQLIKLVDCAAHVWVLDHHKTAREALTGLSYSKLTIAFDAERSGAGLVLGTWVPEMVSTGMELQQRLHLHQSHWVANYVEDRDLWRHQLPHSKEINAAIGSWPFTFKEWDHQAARGQEEALADGQAILRYIEHYVAESIGSYCLVSFEGHDHVPLINVTGLLISEILNALALKSVAAGGPSFAIGWQQVADGSHLYSLRSVNNFDVGALAKAYGGGGHLTAAGFRAKHMLF